MWCCMVYVEHKHIPGIKRLYHLVYNIQMDETKVQSVTMPPCTKAILNYITLICDEDLRNTKDSNTNMDIVKITS